MLAKGVAIKTPAGFVVGAEVGEMPTITDAIGVNGMKVGENGVIGVVADGIVIDGITEGGKRRSTLL